MANEKKGTLPSLPKKLPYDDAKTRLPGVNVETPYLQRDIRRFLVKKAIKDVTESENDDLNEQTST